LVVALSRALAGTGEHAGSADGESRPLMTDSFTGEPGAGWRDNYFRVLAQTPAEHSTATNE
jgi:hypothetical protein